MADKDTKFRNEYGIVDWNSFLFYIWENESKDRSITEWAKLYGVARQTLSVRYNSFKAYAEMFNENGAVFANSLARQELNNKRNAAKITIQRRIINNEIRKDALTELIVENFIIPHIKPFVPVSYIKDKINNSSRTKQVFFISDLHYQDKTVSKGLNDIGRMILNAYNGASIIEIVFGGDYIEGRHHKDQQLKSQEESGQSVDVAKIISKQLVFILANTEAKVNVYFLIGNHDENRSGGEKSQENLKDHYVKIIKTIIELALKDYKNFSIKNEPSYQVNIKLGKKNINFRHGHIGNWSDKSLQQNILKEELQLKRSFDHYVFGHFHRFSDWVMKGVDKRFTIGPSMKTHDGNFENSKVIRNTNGIVTFYEDGSVIFIPWKGIKIISGEL